jgi:penicillin-binding protein-related factor A (putative recombinase)
MQVQERKKYLYIFLFCTADEGHERKKRKDLHTFFCSTPDEWWIDFFLYYQGASLFFNLKSTHVVFSSQIISNKQIDHIII